MANEVITLSCLARELKEKLVGGKVSKICEPLNDELLFTIRREQNLLLTICVESNYPRINITECKKDNPYTCPSFCMHLRRYLTNAVIKDVYLYNSDRIICFDFLTKNELFIEQSYKLYVELMGRYSNVILTDGGIITDAIKHILPGENQQRCILPKQEYLPPSNNRVSVFDKKALEELFASPIEINILSTLKSKIGAMSKSTYLEVLSLAGISEDKTSLTEKEQLALTEAVYSLANISRNKPIIIYENDKPKDFFVTKYQTLEHYSYKEFSSLSEALDEFYLKLANSVRINEKVKNIAKSLRNAVKRTQKSIELCHEKLKSAEDYEQDKLYGELIIAYIYKLKKGDTIVRLLNYYDNTEVSVPLFSGKTPSQSAEAYFKRYRKKVKTIESFGEQLRKYESFLEYLLSVEFAITQVKELSELSELNDEFVALGIIKPLKKQSGAVKKPSVLKEYNVFGYKIIVGKNNLQNDRITFTEAKPSDVWLHVKQASGSHTLIKCEGKKPSIEVLTIAAEIAAFHCSVSESPKVEIDYTERKYVSRHPNRKPGMVIYTDYRTLVVAPSERSEFLIN